MAETTKIAWADATFNPWRGCTKVSEGCDNCYAETMSHRNPSVLGVWGDDGKRALAAEAYWRQPFKWNRQAEKERRRRRVFCLSLGDWLEDREDLIQPRGRLLIIIANTPWLDWLLLSKRLEGWRDRMHEVVRETHDGGDLLASNWLDGEFPDNVWVGASVENQQWAEPRILTLLQIPAKIRFLSVEPMIGPIDIHNLFVGARMVVDRVLPDKSAECHVTGYDYLHWVIIGGESGPGARGFDIHHALDLVRQCNEADCPVFVKQMGDHVVANDGIDAADYFPGPVKLEPTLHAAGFARVKLPTLKGGNMDEFPAGLQLRQLPKGVVS